MLFKVDGNLTPVNLCPIPAPNASFGMAVTPSRIIMFPFTPEETLSSSVFSLLKSHRQHMKNMDCHLLI